MMHARIMRQLLVLMMGAVVLCCSIPTPVLADAAATRIKTPAANCSDTYVGLTNKIVGCMQDTISAAAYVYFDGFYPYVASAIGALLTLAVIIYGILLSYGMVEKLSRDTFVLIIKVVCVSWLSASSLFIYKTLTDVMEQAATAVVTYTPQSGTADASGTDLSQSYCMQQMIQQQNAYNTANPGKSKSAVGPWLGMDCLIDTVIGIKVRDPKGPASSLKWFNEKLDGKDASSSNEGPARAMLYFMFSSMQSSIVGLLLAVIGFIFLYGLMMLIVKALFTYIMGYMGVTFLVIVSPLFIPLILFKETKGYFDKWVKMLISFTLQPIIMLVFIIFSLTAMDLAVYSGKYSIMYRIAGDASQEAQFDLNTYLSARRTADGQVDSRAIPESESLPIILKKSRQIFQIKSAPSKSESEDKINKRAPLVEKSGYDPGGVISHTAKTQCTEEAIKADETGELKRICGYQYPVLLWSNAIDWNRLAAARTPPVEVSDLEIEVAVENNKDVKVKDAEGKVVTLTREEIIAQVKGQKIAQEVLASMLFCGVLVFILNGLLTVVPLVAYDLLGDFGQSANLGGAGGSVFSGIANRMRNTVQSGVGRR